MIILDMLAAFCVGYGAIAMIKDMIFDESPIVRLILIASVLVIVIIGLIKMSA